MSVVLGSPHTGLYTLDAHKCEEFYGKIFDLKKLFEMGPMDMPGMFFTFLTTLQAPNGAFLEVFQVKEPHRQPIPAKGFVTGYQELVFDVEGLEEFVEETKAKGIVFDGPITTVEGRKQVSATGPDKEHLLFVEHA